jgi:flavin reductase (DIM6/NTAB) family NADH-FMN oxidoreductase RutF
MVWRGPMVHGALTQFMQQCEWGALAWLECRLTGEHATGDHVIVFGTVEHGGLLRAGDPAVHLRKNGLAY